MIRARNVVFVVVFAFLRRAADGAQDGGYYCAACTVFVEATHVAIADEARRVASGRQIGRSGSKAQIDMMGVITNMCKSDERFLSGYREDIREGCAMLARDNAIPIARLFSGDPPTAQLAYRRTRDLCVEKLGVCDGDDALKWSSDRVGDLGKRKRLPRCRLCQAFADDFAGVLLRYASPLRKESLMQSLDEVCATVSVRYPARLGEAMEEFCDDVVDDIGSSELLAAFEDAGGDLDETCPSLPMANFLRDRSRRLFCTSECPREENGDAVDRNGSALWWWFRGGEYA